VSVVADKTHVQDPWFIECMDHEQHRADCLFNGGANSAPRSGRAWRLDHITGVAQTNAVAPSIGPHDGACAVIGFVAGLLSIATNVKTALVTLICPSPSRERRLASN
jgi:hypothetical protein